MASNLIFCFTGTGNSLKAAKDIAEVLGDTEIVLMKGDYRLNGKYDRIGFVFPCYARGIPKAALQFVKTLDIKPDTADYIFAVVTCGGSGEGNSMPMLNRVLAQKGATLHYGKATMAVPNYVAMYPMKEDIKERLQTADEAVSICANEIKDKTKEDIRKFSLYTKLFYAAGNMYFRSNAKKFAVSDACTSCGRCEKICPTGSVKLENGKPLFTWETCAQCMACLQWCPVKAIDCGKETESRGRYHHPEIQVNELI